MRHLHDQLLSIERGQARREALGGIVVQAFLRPLDGANDHEDLGGRGGPRVAAGLVQEGAPHGIEHAPRGDKRRKPGEVERGSIMCW